MELDKLSPEEKVVVIEINEKYERTKTERDPTRLKEPFNSPVSVVFAHEKAFLGHNHWNLPDEFLRIINMDLNGAVFFDYTIPTKGDKITKHISWTCFKLKMVKDHKKYDWIQTTVLVRWDTVTPKMEVLFINIPDWEDMDGTKWIEARIPTTKEQLFYPFAWHALFGQLNVSLYERSLWGVRDLVRPVEKKRDARARDLPNLHDLARHLYHTKEVLNVAEDTLTRLSIEHDLYQKEYKDEIPDSSAKASRGVMVSTKQRFFFIAKELHSLRMRSVSMTERLDNELNLAFNLTAYSETSSMNTIAFVTMIFLPGTFVSGVFGTNFFDLNSPDPDSWMTSSNFWLYWAVTVPLTIVTMIFWAFLHGYPTKLYRKAKDPKGAYEKAKEWVQQRAEQRRKRKEQQPEAPKELRHTDTYV